MSSRPIDYDSIQAIVQEPLDLLPRGTIVTFASLRALLGNRGCYVTDGTLSALGKRLCEQGHFEKLSAKTFVKSEPIPEPEPVLAIPEPTPGPAPSVPPVVPPRLARLEKAYMASQETIRILVNDLRYLQDSLGVLSSEADRARLDDALRRAMDPLLVAASEEK